MLEICSKLTTKTSSERRNRRSPGISIVIFEQISHSVLVILDVAQVNAGWEQNMRLKQ